MNAKDKSSPSPPPSSNEVQVHFVVHQQNEDLKIDFSFDKVNDDIDALVSELIETLGMTESDKGTIKALIEQQINATDRTKSSNLPDQNFEPIATNGEGTQSDQSDDSSDDNDIADPEYRSLIEQQRRDMQSLLVRHLSERRDLAQRIQVSVVHQQPQNAAQTQTQQNPASASASVNLNGKINADANANVNGPVASAPQNPPINIGLGQKTPTPDNTNSQISSPTTNPPSTLCDDLIVF